MKNMVTAIIVTFNSEDTISSNLDALAVPYRKGEARVVVVDNTSADGTVAIVRERYPWVRLIESGANLGYGRGLNAGLVDASTPYVLFMNPDAVLPYDSLNTLLGFMESHPNAGIAAPSILRSNGAFQEAGGLPAPSWILRAAIGAVRDDARRREIRPDSQPFETDWVCGAIMLCRTDLVKRIGGFDPRFFLYYEETDLCLRVREEAGAEIWAVGGAVAHHASNSSARKVEPGLRSGECLQDPLYRSRFYYLAKHHGLPLAVIVELGELILLGVHDLLVLFIKRKPAGAFWKRMRAPILRFPEHPVL